MKRTGIHSLDPDSARKRISTARSNGPFMAALLDRDHRGHKDAVDQWTRLHEAAFPEPSAMTAHRPNPNRMAPAGSGTNSISGRSANNSRASITRAQIRARPIKNRLRDADNGDHPITPATAADGRGHSEPPILNNEAERIRAIIENAPAQFEIAENRDADPDYGAWRASHTLGRNAVRRYESIIEREANAQGVDADLVKAIMYVENAQGLDSQAAEAVDIFESTSLLPMNVRPDPWAAIEDPPAELSDPETNIRIAVTLIKRISERIDNPTPAKVASIWVFTGRELVNDYGERVADVYRRRLWETSVLHQQNLEDSP